MFNVCELNAKKYAESFFSFFLCNDSLPSQRFDNLFSSLQCRVNCDGAVFAADGGHPLLPYRLYIQEFSQQNSGLQSLGAQLFTASDIPLTKVDYSHNQASSSVPLKGFGNVCVCISQLLIHITVYRIVDNKTRKHSM